MQRVTGVMSKPCSRCGTELSARTQRDGGVAYGPCSTCQPDQARQTAQAEDPSSETANESITRTAGTDTDTEESQ